MVVLLKMNNAMKHIASILLPFLVAMVCACSKETVQTDQEVRTPLPSLSDRTIRCYAPPVTRTAYGEEEEGAFPVIWKSGDAIRLWASDGSASADYSCADDGADVAFTSETGLSGSGRLARQIIAEVGAAKAASLPEQMIQNIANGRIQKFLKESTLVEQEYQLSDDKISVKAALAAADKEAKVLAFKRFSLAD